MEGKKNTAKLNEVNLIGPRGEIVSPDVPQNRSRRVAILQKLVLL